MSKFINHITLKLLSQFKIYPARITDRSDLQLLLNKLRPVSFGKDLIRLGSKRDGGYLVPDDFEGIHACFSAGVGHTSGFELDCANMGMNVFLDNSVEELPASHELFKFTKNYIGASTKDEFITLDDWVASSVSESLEELMLQIDIEGSEYEVLLSATDKLLNRFRIIVVEFHKLDQLWNRPFFNFTCRVFYKLLQTHSCVHNHPNNAGGSTKMGELEIPSTIELTFLRKDRVIKPSFIKTFPHPLDIDNVKKNPPLILPKCWYT